MNNNFHTLKLGKLGKISMCKRILKEETSNTEEIPFYKISTFGGKPDTFISKKRYLEYKSKYSYPKKGDILISASGTIGKTVIFNDEDAYFQDSNIVWIDNNELIVRNDFLYYFYQTNPWTSTNGSTIKRLYNDDLRNIVIHYPDINKQQKIVNVLSSLDSKIELNNKINKELETMAKTLYDYWFVQFDFPNENGKPYKSSGGKMVYNQELKREIPERWEVEKLNRFLDIDTGYSFQSSSYLEDGKYKIITIKNVKQGMLNTDKVDYINDIPERIKTTSILKLGDILISLTGDVARVCFVNEENTLLNQRVGHIFSIDKEISNSLIYFIMKSDHIYNKAVDIATGSNQKNLSGIDLLNLKIPFSRKLINSFLNKVQPSFEQMLNIQKQNQELAKLRDWLLPMLMNGQVKVEI
ncbi:restriction endonuclease subunit S [Aliarcobacter cryaerophilus]|uniref:restriction endonuclease subunit S n=1 Tax=Aliarcobacter cryaerophilus TaxID=28198 RepID=UPI003DA25B57